MANWDINKLSTDIKYRVVKSDGVIQDILYEGEVFQGNPTEIFAYLGLPETGNGQAPGMVCVHGGGGTAFRKWVEMWVKRGYAAIAMDLGGCDSDGNRLSNGGPEQDHVSKFNTKARWQERKWRTAPALFNDGAVEASLPENVSACFLAIEDERGARVTSPWLMIEPESGS